MKPTVRVSPTRTPEIDYARQNQLYYSNNPGSHYTYDSALTMTHEPSTTAYFYPSMNYANEMQPSPSAQFIYANATDTSSNHSNSYSNIESNSGKKMKGEYQTWVRRDTLRRAAPYTSDRGMNLMQKMGWNPGQGLGRAENGSLDLKFPDIKLDKRGLGVAEKELKLPLVAKSRYKIQRTSIKIATEGKHPVSILEEYCSKLKIAAPVYKALVDEGPVHDKKYLFQVTVDGITYTGDKESNVKKTARMEAAKRCLINLSILSED